MFNIKVFFIMAMALFGSINNPLVYAQEKNQNLPYTPVTTPNGSTMPWTLDKDGAKVFYSYGDANYSIKNLPLSDEELVLP